MRLFVEDIDARAPHPHSRFPVAGVGTLPTRDLIDAYTQQPGTILSVMPVAPAEVRRYGIVRPGPNGVVSGLVGKPASGIEPSLMASIARYLLELEIFDILRVLPPGYRGEFQLADASNIRDRPAFARLSRVPRQQIVEPVDLVVWGAGEGVIAEAALKTRCTS